MGGLPFVLARFLVFWLGAMALKAFARADPAKVSRMVRRGGGGLALAAAGVLILRGRVDAGLAVGGLGLWLLGFANAPWARLFPSGVKRASAGNRSSMRSPTVEMVLDHDSGALDGRVLVGPAAGQALSALDRAQCDTLYRDCHAAGDADGARLLEAYFDRRFAGWRGANETDDDARAPGGGAGRNAMTEQDAYDVLGLPKGAAADEIIRAHHALMKKLHPDVGGSTNLAALVNEAKDVLMRRHS